jgi:hypothetical protein
MEAIAIAITICVEKHGFFTEAILARSPIMLPSNFDICIDPARVSMSI